MNQKYCLETVQAAFKKEGYILLSTIYVGPHSNLDFECSEGHKGQVTWSNFKHNKSRCSLCDIESKRRSLTYIKLALEKEGYKLLSNTYKWYRSKLDCLCPRQHEIQITWNTFRDGHRCKVCRQEEIQPSFEEVKCYFEKYQYQLLSTKYIKSNTYLQYKCPKGHEGRIRWNNFQQGHRCSRCRELKSQKKLGEILEQIFPGIVGYQDNLGFLGRQRVDFSIRSFNLAFEYDGPQHFQPLRFVGMSAKQAQEHFPIQQEWDKRKKRLCVKNRFTLIRVKYTEELTLENIRAKIQGHYPKSYEEVIHVN